MFLINHGMSMNKKDSKKLVMLLTVRMGHLPWEGLVIRLHRFLAVLMGIVYNEYQDNHHQLLHFIRHISHHLLLIILFHHTVFPLLFHHRTMRSITHQPTPLLHLHHHTTRLNNKIEHPPHSPPVHEEVGYTIPTHPCPPMRKSLIKLEGSCRLRIWWGLPRRVYVGN